MFPVGPRQVFQFGHIVARPKRYTTQGGSKSTGHHLAQLRRLIGGYPECGHLDWVERGERVPRQLERRRHESPFWGGGAGGGGCGGRGRFRCWQQVVGGGRVQPLSAHQEVLPYPVVGFGVLPPHYVNPFPEPLCIVRVGQ